MRANQGRRLRESNLLAHNLLPQSLFSCLPQPRCGHRSSLETSPRPKRPPPTSHCTGAAAPATIRITTIGASMSNSSRKIGRGWRKFREADASLGPPAPDENRVVFMGDSITEGWHLDAVVSRQALHQPRHQRTDHSADAGALPSGRDRILQPKGGGHSGRHQRHCRQHRPGDPGADRRQPGLHGRPGHGQPHPRRALLHHAGIRLPLEAGTGPLRRKSTQSTPGSRAMPRTRAMSTSTTIRP